MKKIWMSFLIFAILSTPAKAWNEHGKLTRFSLEYQDLPKAVLFQKIEPLLKKLVVEESLTSAESKEEFCAQLKIQCSKINWNWVPEKKNSESEYSPIDILVYSVDEPDRGMDQDLNISEDQKYMGGYTGLGSQAIRHMTWPAWSWKNPVSSFHVPMHEMGMAIQRAELYYWLAQQAVTAGNLFWAYRFLGWGLHYAQDLTQPYHTSQFGSLKLLALGTLLKQGWEPFIQETTRQVSNSHLFFETYVQFGINSVLGTLEEENSVLRLVFKVPNADSRLKYLFENKGLSSIRALYAVLLESGQNQIGKIISTQHAEFSSYLSQKGLKIGFENKIPDSVLQQRSKSLDEVASLALSNTGIITRWYFERFLQGSSTH